LGEEGGEEDGCEHRGIPEEEFELSELRASSNEF
jgi:hypothetical protein